MSALLLVGLVAIAALLYAAARGRDEVALAASQHMARLGVAALQQKISGIVRDYAEWDDAMENLHVAFNPAWAADNIGGYVHETLSVSDVLVIGPDGQIVFHSGSTKGEDGSPAPSIEPSLGALEQAARTAPGDSPAVTGFVSIGDATLSAAAKRIAYYDVGKAHQDEAASVLVFAHNLDESLLAKLGEDNLLPRLRFSRTAELEEGELSMPLPAFGDGAILGHLVW